MKQRRKCSYGTYVGVKSQLLAHTQQTLLGTDFGRGIVVVFGVADGAEQHGVGFAADFVRLLRVGIPRGVDGAGAHQRFAVGEVVRILPGDVVQRLDGLRDDLRTDAVAG